MAPVPHSGNACSGLCRERCGHEGCWQCHDMGSEADERAASRLVHIDTASQLASRAFAASELRSLIDRATEDAMMTRAQKDDERVAKALKASGASDADIEAARKVLRWKLQ